MNLFPKILAAVLFVVVSYVIYSPARLSYWDTWISLWSISYVAGFVPIVLESAFFVKSQRWRTAHLAVAFVVTGVAAGLAAGVAASDKWQFTLPEKCLTMFAEQSIVDWVLRFGGVSGLYVFLYGVIGTATRPFLRPYYDDPENELELNVPATKIIIFLQVVRGTLTTAALIPLLAVVPALTLHWWINLSILLATIMGIIPLMIQSKWPARLRFIHGVEISVFAIAYSFVVWLMIAQKIVA